MEAKVSSFESSEMLATFLASTPLLEESWKLCHHANIDLVQNFVVNHVGEVNYVAFLPVQKVGGANSRSKDSVALGTAAKGFFTVFNRHDEGEEPVMFHAGLLQLFLALYNTHITI
ncbi:lipase-like PAD4 [Abeliophyllum distichum]|uniref:Lipase-like PAD4 n=1 Tax=Abeliophyllum distichum TaxID=126358 RepID=A0ABD1RVN8_9LAMI